MANTTEPIKTELFRNLESLVNEIDVSFEEINVDKMNKYIKKLKNDNLELDTFVKNTYTHLHEYEKQLSLVLFSNKKIRTPEYKFVDDIHLFPDSVKHSVHLLNFNVFSAENKNTKKSLLKYIYNIYMSCFFLQSTASSSELSNFLSNITKYSHPDTPLETLEEIEEISIPSTIRSHQGNLPDLGGLGNLGGGLGGLENLMSSLMNNSDIMSIANEISNDMKNETINPMDLMTSLMSGNMTDGPLSNLMNKIQTSVDSKINSGEINQAELEKQAHNIINQVQETPGLSNIPGLSDLLNKKL